MKQCSKCKHVKDYFSFNKNKYNNDGHQYRCRECVKLHYIKTKAHVSNRAKEYAALHKSEKAQYDKLRRETKQKELNNHDKIRAKLPHRRALSREQTAKRRALIKNASVNWNEELNKFVIKEAYTLAIQREQTTGIKWHVDHIIPLKGKVVCGLHVWNNLQVIPAKTNILKRNKFAPHFERRN